MTKLCVICGKEFDANRSAKTCGSKCRKERHSRRRSQWRKSHPERTKEQLRRYRKSHPDRSGELDGNKLYRKKNRKKIRESQRRYRKEHPEKYRALSHRYYLNHRSEEHTSELQSLRHL